MSSPQSDNVLIFGATGEVGSAAALEASSRGAKVWLGMRDVNKTNPWLTSNEEKIANMSRIQADLSDPTSLTAAVQESHAKAAYVYAVHTGDAMRSSLTALKDAGIQHIVFLSTVSIKGDIRAVSRSHFIPWHHAQIEISLQGLDLPHTTIRAGFFASNALRLYLDNTRTPSEARVFAADVLHDPIDPKDVGRVAGALVTNHAPTTNVYYLYGPELLSQRRQWELINDALERRGKPKVNRVEITETQYLGRLLAKHVPKPVAESLLLSMTDTSLLYLEQDYLPGRENVRKLSNHEPTRFEDFVRRELDRYFK